MQRETIRRGEGFRFDGDRVRGLDPAGRVMPHHPAPDVTEIVSARDIAAEVTDETREPAPSRRPTWRRDRRLGVLHGEGPSKDLVRALGLSLGGIGAGRPGRPTRGHCCPTELVRGSWLSLGAEGGYAASGGLRCPTNRTEMVTALWREGESVVEPL